MRNGCYVTIYFICNSKNRVFTISITSFYLFLTSELSHHENDESTPFPPYFWTGDGKMKIQNFIPVKK